jgi:hypothetical protein
MPRPIVGFAVLTISIGIALGAAELAARAVFDRQGMHYGLEMWKYAKTLKRVSANPRIGHEHVPGTRARLMGTDVRINSIGLRNAEVARDPTGATLRILVLGDSMTFGWGAKEKKRVAGPDRHVEVVNAGVGNYNTVQEAAYFAERGLALRPDVVLLGFYINDAEPVPTRETGWLAEHSYLYVLASSLADALQRKVGWREGYEDYYARLYREDSHGWQDCRQALADLARLTSARGIALAVVLIPELHFPGGRYPFDHVHGAVTRVAAGLGAQVIDLRNAFAGIEPRSLWVSPGDAHPNARAHRVIAERIRDEIHLPAAASPSLAARDGLPGGAPSEEKPLP